MSKVFYAHLALSFLFFKVYAELPRASEACEQFMAMSFDGPDLNRVRIFVRPEVAQEMRGSGHTPESLGAAVRAAVREPVRLTTFPHRYLLYLTDLKRGAPTRRVEFDWFREHGSIQILKNARYDRTIDSWSYLQSEKIAPLRNFPVRATLTNHHLQKIKADGFELADLAAALGRPFGPAVNCTFRQGLKWSSGPGARGQRISVLHTPPNEDGIVELTAAAPMTEYRKRIYFSQCGFQGHGDEAPLEITSGPYRFREIRFGVGLSAKVEFQHGLTRAQVIEAFEKSLGSRPYEGHSSGQSPRRYFVSKLASGLMVKVCYAAERNGSLVLITAYPVDAIKWRRYLDAVAKS